MSRFVKPLSNYLLSSAQAQAVHIDTRAMGDAIEALEARVTAQEHSLGSVREFGDMSGRETMRRLDGLDAHVADLLNRVKAIEAAAKPEPLADGEYVVTLKPNGFRQVAKITDGRWFEDCGLAADGRRVWIASGAPHWIGPRVDVPE